MTRLATPISDLAHPKNFQSAFNLCGSVSKKFAKNYTVLSICSGEMVDLKILESG